MPHRLDLRRSDDAVHRPAGGEDDAGQQHPPELHVQGELRRLALDLEVLDDPDYGLNASHRIGRETVKLHFLCKARDHDNPRSSDKLYDGDLSGGHTESRWFSKGDEGRARTRFGSGLVKDFTEYPSN